MADYMDFFNSYVMGIVQMLTGFYYFTRFLRRKAGPFAYLMFLLCAIAMIIFLPGGSIIEFLGYALLLIASGIFICYADGKAVVLYAALTVEIMQFSYGITNSLTSVLYPQIFPFHPRVVGLAFMVLGNVVALLLAVFCYHMACRYFSYFETLKKPHVPLVLIPILMIFFMEEYIGSIIYGSGVTDNRGIVVYANHYQMFVIQVLGMASLSNIKAIAEKYHGAMSTKTEGTAFVLSVLLIIPRQSENASRQILSSAVSDNRNLLFPKNDKI